MLAKALDPTTGVREAEKKGLVGGSLVEKFQQYFNQYKTGQLFTPEQILDVKGAFKTLHTAREREQLEREARYKIDLELFGLRDSKWQKNFQIVQPTATGKTEAMCPKNQSRWQ